MLKRLLSVALIVLCSAAICLAGGTKQFKFLQYGTYTVPEEFPDNFVNMPSQVLYQESLANDRGVIAVVEHALKGAPDTALFVTVTVYGDKDCRLAILHVMTTTAKLNIDPEKWVTLEYYDKELFETGKPSRVLIPVGNTKLDFKKFRADRITALERQEI